MIRVTGNIADFINKNLLPFHLINSVKSPGPKVRYYRGSGMKDNIPSVISSVLNDLLSLLDSGRYSPSDIFILAPSVKDGKVSKQTYVNQLANLLLEHGYPYFAPAKEDIEIDQTMMDGKVVLSTFHQSKGLERKVVVVTCFCQDYYEFYARDDKRLVCSNTLYVATTRAIEQLILIGESSGGGQLPFLRNLVSSDHLEIIEVGKLMSKKKADEYKEKFKNVTVTNLIKFLPESVYSSIFSVLKSTIVRKASTGVNLKGQIITVSNHVEDVSELNGVALPAMFEARKTNNVSTIQKYCQDQFYEATNIYPTQQYYKQLLKEVEHEPDPFNITAFLRMSAIYNFASSGFNSKALQIKNYNWISTDAAEVIMERLSENLRGESLYEIPIEINQIWNGQNLTITGRIDAVTNSDTIWELKCVNQIQDDHLLQLAVYLWMSQRPIDKVVTGKELFGNKVYRNRLLNMRTNELIEITSYYELDYVVEILIEHHLRGSQAEPDKEFLKNNEKIRSDYFSKKRSSSTNKSSTSPTNKSRNSPKNKSSTIPKNKSSTSPTSSTTTTSLLTYNE